MERKLIFRGAYRLLGTGIVECLEIIHLTDPDSHILYNKSTPLL